MQPEQFWYQVDSVKTHSSQYTADFLSCHYAYAGLHSVIDVQGDGTGSLGRSNFTEIMQNFRKEHISRESGGYVISLNQTQMSINCIIQIQ